MTRKPTYDELVQKIRMLEDAAVNGKRLEDALRQSKEAFQSLFDDHTSVKLVIDPDTGAIVKANHAAATFYGWSRETLAEMNIQQIEMPLPGKIKAVRDNVTDQKPPHFEFQHILADGSVRDVEVFSKRITMDGHGYLHSIIHDITERKRAEQEKTIIAEIGRIISSSLNIDEVYKRFADEACKLIPLGRINLNVINHESGAVKIAYMSGIPIEGRNPGASFPLEGSYHEELIRTRTGHILDETSIEELTKRSPYVFNVYKAGIRSLLTVPLISRDEVIGSLGFHTKKPNAYTERELSLAQRIGDQIAGAIANAQLFTDLKKADRSLRESEARLRSMFNQAAVGVAEVDIPKRRFITVNRRLCELVGMTEEELLVTTIKQLTHPVDFVIYEEGIKKLRSGEIDKFTMEKRYIKKDGAIIWVSITLSPLGNTVKASGRYICIVQDITERRLAQQESERRAGQMAALHEMGLQLMAELNLDELLNSIAQHALKVIGGTSCIFYLYRPAEDLLERVATAGLEMALDCIASPINYRRGVGFAGHIWKTKAPLLVADYHSWPKRIKGCDTIPPCALVGTPILWSGEMLGVLSLVALLPHQYTQSDAELLDMLAMQAAIAVHNARLYDHLEKNITEREKVEEVLRHTLDQLESRVQERTIELQEINAALQVVLKKGGADQRIWEEGVQSNINELVMPFLQRLKNHLSDKASISYLNVLETNLNTITSPFINQLSTAYKNLTPKEVQIAELIKQGKSSKDIAELFGLSLATVVTHRNNIRKKMRLTSKKANLRSHLLFLS